MVSGPWTKESFHLDFVILNHLWWNNRYYRLVTFLHISSGARFLFCGMKHESLPQTGKNVPPVNIPLVWSRWIWLMLSEDGSEGEKRWDTQARSESFHFKRPIAWPHRPRWMHRKDPRWNPCPILGYVTRTLGIRGSRKSQMGEWATILIQLIRTLLVERLLCTKSHPKGFTCIVPFHPLSGPGGSTMVTPFHRWGK